MSQGTTGSGAMESGAVPNPNAELLAKCCTQHHHGATKHGPPHGHKDSAFMREDGGDFPIPKPGLRDLWERYQGISSHKGEIDQTQQSGMTYLLPAECEIMFTDLRDAQRLLIDSRKATILKENPGIDCQAVETEAEKKKKEKCVEGLEEFRSSGGSTPNWTAETKWANLVDFWFGRSLSKEQYNSTALDSDDGGLAWRKENGGGVLIEDTWLEFYKEHIITETHNICTASWEVEGK